MASVSGPESRFAVDRGTIRYEIGEVAIRKLDYASLPEKVLIWLAALAVVSLVLSLLFHVVIVGGLLGGAAAGLVAWPLEDWLATRRRSNPNSHPAVREEMLYSKMTWAEVNDQTASFLVRGDNMIIIDLAHEGRESLIAFLRQKLDPSVLKIKSADEHT